MASLADMFAAVCGDEGPTGVYVEVIEAALEDAGGNRLGVAGSSADLRALKQEWSRVCGTHVVPVTTGREIDPGRDTHSDSEYCGYAAPKATVQSALVAETQRLGRREVEVITWWAGLAKRAEMEEMLRDLNAPDAAPAKDATHLARERR